MSRPWRPAPTTSIYDLRWLILLLQLFPYTHFRNLFFFSILCTTSGLDGEGFFGGFLGVFLAFTELYVGGHLQAAKYLPICSNGNRALRKP